jgi:hypothetical protein
LENWKELALANIRTESMQSVREQGRKHAVHTRIAVQEHIPHVRLRRCVVRAWTGRAAAEAGRSQAKAARAPAQGKRVHGGGRDLAAEFFSGEVDCRAGGRSALTNSAI